MTHIPFDNHQAWTRLGRSLGRRNAPRRPADDVPPRAQLQVQLMSELQAARRSYLTAVGHVDEQRAVSEHQLRTARQNAKADSYIAGMLAQLKDHRSALDEERNELHEELLQTVDEIVCRAESADSKWRAANQHARDRRIIIEPTHFIVPVGLTGAAPDPLA